MRLALSSYTYTWSIGVPGQLPAQPMTAVDLLERAAAFAVNVVQVADNLPLDRLSASELDTFEATAKRLGIAIEVGTRGIMPDHLRLYLALAQRFRSPILRVVIDTATHHPTPDEVVAMLAPFEAEFRRAGIRLAIENHDRFAAPVFVDIVRQLGDWAGICLDTVNSFGALEGPRVVVDALGPLTLNLHIKDFTIFRASHMMGFNIEGRPAGQGRLGVPWVMEALHAYGCDADGTMSAVLELWTPPEPALSDTIAKEQRWAEESVAYMRTVIL
jgi:sugar phosphate isomerase/epimerase